MSVDADGGGAKVDAAHPVAAHNGGVPEATAEQIVVDRSVKRVIILRLGSLGDTLVALPSYHLIARAFPEAERRLLTNVPVVSRAPAAAAVLGDSGLVHGYESYPVGTRNPLRLVALLLRLRRFRPDVAIYLKAETGRENSRRDRLFLRWTGARRVVGVTAEGETAARRLAGGDWEPEVERLLRSLHELGSLDAGRPQAWDLRLTEAETRRADEVRAPLEGKPYVAASIGTKVQAKDWGIRNWSELMREVASRYPGCGLLLAGAPEERSGSDAVADAWAGVAGAGPAINLCGDLSPRESAAAFAGARAFLGHDSGPMHLAAAVGTPVVAIFAARNRPLTWYPYGAVSRVLYHRVDCAGCGLETCVEQRKKCILSITVTEVMDALNEVVKGAA